MWRPWAKSTVKIHDTSSSPFSFPTFKDIQSLCTEDHPSGQIKKSSSIFHRVRVANTFLRSLSLSLPEPKPEPEPEPGNNASPASNKTTTPPLQQQPSITIPGTDKRIVVYYTSLRVVRSTFEDCKIVLSILRGFRVLIDERDLSMDSSFLNELNQIFSNGGDCGRNLTLPRVFVGGRYMGGAEETTQLNESGELKKIIEGLPVVDSGVCEVCCGYRFILCGQCNGSHKLYIQKAGFKSCTACNENGLIRCPSCAV
ncbi:hypothetical protein OIU77_016754 [Salix suchowensis]|uniref:Glutaredoxin domain-containing protein n=2 Tax=Salix TaxID=40685 RepID=A0A9Q1A1X5_SALPP|nr:hypothetical protein OIU77_016754 [Salix suchowensis]KAJ6315332.1 hypothetical protein OIU78_018757 [Salix suchowensis]KAJ6754964.1 hypothetical protein OIU79_027557 [Salix purpurea]